MEVGSTDEVIQSLALKFHCKFGKSPLLYLGLPIRGKVRSKEVWNPVVENFKRKLSMWKRNYLSLVGRITLIKVSSSNLPVYCMFLLKMTVEVREKLDRLRREYLWGGRHTKGKLHLSDGKMFSGGHRVGKLGI